MSFLRFPNLTDVLNKSDFIRNNIIGAWTVQDNETHLDICTFDTFIGYEFSQENSVLSYPIENGSFASYNKVASPARMNVYLAKSGYPFELKAILDALDEYVNSTKKVDIVLPFKTYKGYNIEKYSHSIKSGDAGDQLIIELPMVEIKEVSLSYRKTKLPAKKVRSAGLADTENVGKKQSTTPNQSSIVKIRNWISKK